MSEKEVKEIEMNIEEVIPYEFNPRNNDDAVEVVMNSIKEFGFQQPILVDKNHVIITGHTRLKAAKKLGYKKVPVRIAYDMTPEQVKAYRLADNKTGEFANWDFDLLEMELDEIKTDFDMEAFGFDNFSESAYDDEGASESFGETEEHKHQCPMCGYAW